MPLLIVLAAWFGAVALVLPTEAMPLFDDWVYSRAAMSLAGQGILDLPEWSAVYPLFQVVWGALFLHLPLVPELALRLSTLVLSLAGSLCWYAALRRRGLTADAAAVAVALVLFNPVYFLLSVTFMTDVVFLALCQMAFAALVLWSRDKSAGWFALVLTTVLAASFTRQLGLALVVGLAVAAFAGRRPLQAAVAVASAATVVVGQVVFSTEVGGGLPLTNRFIDLLAVFSVSPGLYIDGLAVAAAFAGLSLAPLVVRGGCLRPRILLLTLAGLLVVVFVWETPLLREGQVLGACDLGGARSLLSGRPPVCPWQGAAGLAAFVLACLGLAGLVPVVVERLRKLYARPAADPVAAGVAVSALLLVAGMTALWLLADRYWLVPALLAAPLLAGSVSQRRALRLGASVLLVCYALVGVAGASSAFSMYRRVNVLADGLQADGVESRMIDGGYAVNGRRIYLALPRAPRDQGRNAGVAWVSGLVALPFTIANSVEEGWQKTGRGDSKPPFVVRPAGLAER